MQTRAKKEADAGDVSRISRDDAAKVLGTTKSAVRHLEAAGQLRTVEVGADGKMVWLDRGEVIALAAARQRRRPGRLTQGTLEAAAMALFARYHEARALDGCVPDVMIATLLPAAEVIRLRAIFARERGIELRAAPPPPSAPAPIDRAREKRDEDERIARERAEFEREMRDRHRAIDRELGAEGEDEEEPRPRAAEERRKKR